MFRSLRPPPATAVVIDDNPAVARGLARAVEACGYQVVGIAHAPDELTPYLDGEIGLLVIDVHLGGASGFELARQILERCEAPVVFVTGTNPDLAELAGYEGVFAFLEKPFTQDALHKAIAILRMQNATRARLRWLEKHYHGLFEQAAVGVAQFEVENGRVVDVNPTCADTLSSTVKEMIGADFFAWLGPGDREPLRRALAALDVDDQHVVELECRYGEDRAVWIRLTASRHANEKGQVVVIVQDITERERATSARRESEERERNAVAASRAKTDFLAHMSHELRTPLNAVLGLSEALLESTFGALNDSQAEALATIHKSGRHLLELINDVLDIARVESGRLPIDAQQIALRPLLEESAALIHAQVGAKGQRLVLDFAPNLPPVDADRRRLKQVLLNLLGNAVKFSGVGATICLRVSVMDDREIAISVEDNGPGIAPEDFDHIFEPFYTGDLSTTRNHDGAGLGLALVKRIVELHGGKVAATSEPGAGCRFTVTLPCSVAYVPGPAATGPLSAAMGVHGRPRSSPTVLLAEDNDATVFAMRSYLEARGFTVRTVRDGASAYDAALDPTVAAILMDIRLDGVDGLEATRRIRANPVSTTKPIIALTAYAMPDDEERCLAAGASAYLAKPVSLKSLTTLLDQLLEDRA